MTIYYVKQNNTIWGCGEIGCCGPYIEEIDEIFVDYDEKERVSAESLESFLGGGEVLEYRKATYLEIKAFQCGAEGGFERGSAWERDRDNS